jgi:hypothetical protein
MMTRKHFNAIIEALHDNKPDEATMPRSYTQWKNDVEGIAVAIEENSSNPKFDKARFVHSCKEGLNEDDTIS